MKLVLDPKRYIEICSANESEIATMPNLPYAGICVRAETPQGNKYNADISLLDWPSLRRWLRSGGGTNVLAERTVAVLLGHAREDLTDEGE